MKIKHFSRHSLLVPCLALGVVFSSVHTADAVEFRTWTNQKGTKIEAQLVRADGDEIVLLLRNGKEARVKHAVLSLADQQYLKEYGGIEGDAVDQSGEPSVPEKDAKIDTKTFVRIDEPFVLEGTELAFKVLESEHFKILSLGKANTKDTAELAERMWHGMAFQHPNFSRNWGDTKMGLMLVEEDSDYEMLGNWYVEQIAKSGREGAQNDADTARLTWNKVASTSINLEPSFADSQKMKTLVRVFRCDGKRKVTKVFDAFRTHCIAGALASFQMGGVSEYGSEGAFAISTGHSYYKEILLTGETATQMVDANAYESSEVKTMGGFEDGRNWPKIIRELMRKDKLKPDIKELYRAKSSGLTPEQVVLMYGFSRYLQSTVGRLAHYATMAERISSSKQIPEPIELAKIYGFNTVDEMQADWIDYMSKSSFR